MLTLKIKSIRLNVIMLGVIILSVAAPCQHLSQLTFNLFMNLECHNNSLVCCSLWCVTITPVFLIVIMLNVIMVRRGQPAVTQLALVSAQCQLSALKWTFNCIIVMSPHRVTGLKNSPHCSRLLPSLSRGVITPWHHGL